MRPRFGPGPKTAVIAGLVVWALGVLVAAIGYGMLGFFPARLVVITTVWGLFEMPIASVAGAWPYKE